MQVTFHPKRLLMTAAAALVMWVLLSLALGANVGSGVFAVVCVAAGVLFDLFFFVNPALWRIGRRNR